MRLCRYATLLAIACLLNATTSVPAIITTQSAYAADEAWKVEFEQACGQTDTAMDMGVDALAKALERCERLKPQIEQLEATPRKIYLKRLQMCCNLFSYMIESRKKDLKP